MQLLICQSCGVVLRNQGKHCTSCGVSLAFNLPTQMPVFKQTRPPLEVSVKQDHLLIERVVNHRQVAVLSNGTSKPTQTSSGAYSSPQPEQANPPANEAAAAGNGNGNGSKGNGNGGNGGNGFGASKSAFVSQYSLPASAQPQSKPTLPQPQPQPQPKSLPAETSSDPTSSNSNLSAVSEPQDSKSLNEFGSVSIEEKARAGANSLMSSLSQKGLINNKKDIEEKPAVKEEETTEQKTSSAIGDIQDWSADSTDEQNSQLSEENETKKSKPDMKTQFLAQGITGSAVSIAIGTTINSAMNGGLAAASRPKKEEVSEPEKSDDAVQSKTEDSPENKDSTEDSKPDASKSFLPDEVGDLAEEKTSEKFSTKDEPSSKAKVSPIASPELPEEVKESEEEPAETKILEEKVAPIQLEEPQSNDADKPSSEDNSQITSESKEESSQKTAQNSKDLTEVSGSIDYDFAEQFGTEFNPEEFFNGTFETKEQEPESQPEETPQDQPVAQSDPAPAQKAPDTEDGEARQEVMDFFGEESPSKQQTAQTEPEKKEEPVQSIVSTPQSSSASDFDFFDSPGQTTAPAKTPKPYVQEKDTTLPQASATSDEDESHTTIITDDPDSMKKPLVAMPKGMTTKEQTERTESEQEVSEDTSEDQPWKQESNEDSDDDEKVKAPKRRNFSGGSSGDDEEADADEDASNLTWLEQQVKLGSLEVSRQTAIILISVGAFIVIQIPSWVMAFASAFSGGGAPPQVAQKRPGMGQPGMAQQGLKSPFGQQGQKMPFGQQGQKMPFGQQKQRTGGSALLASRMNHLRNPAPQQNPQQMKTAPMNGQAGQAQQPFIVGGRWVWKVYAGNKPYPANVMIQQHGNEFSGQGVDGLGNFAIVGSLIPPNKLQFNKQYDTEAKRKGALSSPITFYGEMGRDKKGQIIAQGAYKSHKKVGYEQSIHNPARMVLVGGKWTGVQLAGQSPEASKPDMLASISGLFGGKKGPAVNPSSGGMHAPNMAHKSPQQLHDFFLQVALGLIGVGVLLFMFFLFLFGPSGWMNIWEKKKYIPSQFKSAHLRMVRELGRPLKPGGTPLGKRIEWNFVFFWRPKYLALTPDIREKNPHMLLLGGSDKGKTRLMASMVTHDIQSDDRAIVLIDSDGQLSDLICEWIASQPEGEKYAKRVVLVDPTYKAGSLAYNPLEMPEDGDLQSAASAVVHGFKAIYTEPPGQQGGGQNQWNQQTANILRNSALLLMANGRTLTDLPNLLQDNDFRDIMLETVEQRKSEKTEYINIIDTWNQYKRLARTDQWINWVEPILNRVGPMLGDGRIRPILTKPVSDLKLKDIILQKKILIVKVPQGELDQNANLLGSLIVTGLQQAAMSLGREKPHDIRPSALYLDDLDSFIEKETVEQLCAETKRYQIGFVGSLKTLQHLPEDFKSQLIINIGTMCIFALAKKDGDMLGPQMFRVDGRKIKHQTITNFFNKVNTSPQFELIMDEEKLNIDRIVGQEEQTFFCYRVGTVAGVFKLKAYDFKDVPRKKIDSKLIEKMHAVTDNFASESDK